MRLVEPPPPRTLAQRMDALQRANEIRTYRAEFKRDLKAGRIRISDVLAGPVEERLQTMKVFDLLLAMPKLGRVKANQVLLRAQISPSKTLHGLTDRQRGDLLRRLREHPVIREDVAA